VQANTANLAKGVNTVKTMNKYVAQIVAAAAIGGLIALAPVALNTHGTAPVFPSTAPNKAPAPWSFGTGGDPFVPAVGDADPYVPFSPGMGRAL
jgi:hypothetical protein